MKRILTTTFLLIFLASIAIAQVDLKKIDKYIEKARVEWNVPGLSVAIVKGGKIVHSKGYGVLEKGKSTKVDDNTLFAIASNSKAFISSAIGTLVDQGKLDWKDKVKDHLPYFELYDDYATANANIEDLLSHRLGLGTFSGDVIWYKSELSAEEVVKRAKYVPQAYGFRDGYGYSNLMFITAGEVIRSVTGMSWSDYVKATFFEPLNMDRTITSTNDLSEKGNAATPHKSIRDENKVIPWANWDNMGAAGGIISSSNDMSQWMIFQLNQGKMGDTEILKANTQNRIMTPHNNFTVTEGSKNFRPGRNFNSYALGWGVSDNNGRRIIAHGGGYDGMYSRVAMMPEENLGVVVLTNGMRGISNHITDYIMDMYTDQPEVDYSANAVKNVSYGMYDGIDELKSKRVLNTKPSMASEKYAGIFYTPMYGDIYVKNEGGKLRLEFSHAPLLSATLTHWHYDTYQINWDNEHAWFGFGTVQFNFNAAREISGIHIDVPNGDIFFDELKLEKVNSPSIRNNR
jgi:CubicO group peptidase (beta-lactamase class C family)